MIDQKCFKCGKPFVSDVNEDICNDCQQELITTLGNDNIHEDKIDSSDDTWVSGMNDWMLVG